MHTMPHARERPIGERPDTCNFPLSLGMVGIALAPVWAAIGAIAVLAADLTVVVEKKSENKTSD